MRPKVIFKFDKEKDLKNIYDTANAEESYGHNWKGAITSNVYSICHGKKYSKCKPELKKLMSYIHNNKITITTAKLFNEGWKTIDKEYFRRLEKMMGPFCVKKVIAYLTTAGRCPYYPYKKNPHFFVGFFTSITNAMKVVGHELMHIQFHNSKYWKMCEKEIGWNKTRDLKEALTVLLNLEFRDLWTSEDIGYPNHVKLRKYIEEQWKRKKDFGKLIENCIVWIKKNGIK